MKDIKKQIEDLAKDLMFELSNDDIQNILNEFCSIEEQLKSITNISTIGIQPTSYCIEFESTPLREDEIVEVDSNPFSNCKKFNNKYVVINNEKK